MPDQPLSDYLAYLLASAHRRMRLGISQRIDGEAFTEEHWRILHVLSDQNGRTMGKLAELVLMNGPALTKNTDKLVSRGVVHRVADPVDNRRVLLFISDLGLEVVERLRERVDAHHDSIEEALGPRKTKQLKRLLESFIAESVARGDRSS